MHCNLERHASVNHNGFVTNSPGRSSGLVRKAHASHPEYIRKVQTVQYQLISFDDVTLPHQCHALDPFVSSETKPWWGFQGVWFR